MVASVDDNQDGELNAPEFADFERIVRARAIVNSKKALKVVDADGSGTLTLDGGKRIAFKHYGFDENVLGPFFDQADEDKDGELDAVEFAGFRSVFRARAVKDAVKVMKDVDLDGDGLVSLDEATEKTMAEDDMEPPETATVFNIADQPEVSQTGTDVEYEVVEVLVDENGNEVTIEGSGSDGSVVEPLDSETRKRLIEEQKKLLNLPESTEVEYIEESADPSFASSAGRRSDDEYEEVVEYVEE